MSEKEEELKGKMKIIERRVRKTKEKENKRKRKKKKEISLLMFVGRWSVCTMLKIAIKHTKQQVIHNPFLLNSKTEKK